MIIEINNLGFVKNVKVNLNKDLIVLCGPNNTGKTYVAYAIYGLMKHRYLETKISSISNIIKTLPEKGEVEIDLIKILNEKGAEHLNRVAKSYVKQLPSVFASANPIFDRTQISLQKGNIEKLKENIMSAEIDTQVRFASQISARISKEKGSPLLKSLLINKKHDEKMDDARFPMFIDFLCEQAQSIYLSFFFHNPYIATAERVAINLFSKELSIKRNILVDRLLELKDEGKNKDPLDLVRRRATRYPLPIRDSLEIAEDLNNFKKQTSEYDSFANEIEEDILKGKVIISKDGEVQFKPNANKKVTLPIHLSASIVKSLSNLVIYFRHLAKENDLIILDEPEMNLHPDNQIIVARIIGKMINKKFKVVVNTHSDYIIKELNNLIMLFSNREQVQKYSYSEDEILNPEQVDAILFRYDNKRKSETLNVTEAGFEVDTIDNVINQLNSRSQNLYFG